MALDPSETRLRGKDFSKPKDLGWYLNSGATNLLKEQQESAFKGKPSLEARGAGRKKIIGYYAVAAEI